MDDKREFSLLLNEIEMEKRLKWYENKYGPYIQERGFKNWRNLFRKPNLLEWTIFFMLVMGLFMAWAYNNDVGQCQTFVKTINEDPCYYCRIINTNATYTTPKANFTFIINEDSKGESGG